MVCEEIRYLKNGSIDPASLRILGLNLEEYLRSSLVLLNPKDLPEGEEETRGLLRTFISNEDPCSWITMGVGKRADGRDYLYENHTKEFEVFQERLEQYIRSHFKEVTVY